MSDELPEIDSEPTTGQVVKAAKAAKARIGEAASKVTGKQIGMGAAIGIGSAAIVAALLYTNRNNKKS